MERAAGAGGGRRGLEAGWGGAVLGRGGTRERRGEKPGGGRAQMAGGRCGEGGTKVVVGGGRVGGEGGGWRVPAPGAYDSAGAGQPKGEAGAAEDGGGGRWRGWKDVPGGIDGGEGRGRGVRGWGGGGWGRGAWRGAGVALGGECGAGAESETGEVDSRLKRKRATSDDGASTSKRVRPGSLFGSASTEEETPDAPPTLAAKEVTETPPPNVEATSGSSAPVTQAAQSPPQTGSKAFEGMPVDDRIEEFDMVTAQQAALVTQLRAMFAGERSQSIQKDEEILLLKTQLADAQAEAESARAYAQNLAEEKMALLVKVEQERADAAYYKASCHWAVKYLEGGKNNHFAGLDEFRQRVEGLLGKQEEKLRKLSIEYDEELYPHMLFAIAEHKWLISHGLRLAAMSTLESQEVKQSFGDVVKCALARGKAEAVEELHEKKLLTVPAAQVPGYNEKAYEELVAAMEAMKLLELPHIAQLERDQDYPIGVIMAGLTLARHATEGAEGQPDYFLKPDVAQLQVPIFARPRDILNPFALEKEVPLKESLEAHALRLAKKKGVKGKAILCGVGAAHIPRSDGVPVSVATVSPKDSDLLGKLEEAGDAAYQVGRSEQSRCHSI
ncbi:hypothetical protein Tco_1246986 [Tanacetum coccineum]